MGTASSPFSAEDTAVRPARHAPAPDLHAQSRVEVAEDTDPTLLGLTGAAAIAISPSTWTLPAEFGGLALTGTSVMALARHAVRP